MAYAKISFPRSYNILPRPRLFQLLDGMSKGAGTWIAGPAGAGKTSLLGSYLEASKKTVLWYQLDAGDSDPSSFFSYFGEAARALCAREAPPFPPFAAEHALDLPGFCTRYFRQVFDCLPKPCAIALDDYHEAEGTVLEQLLKAALKEAPADISLYITSRTLPPPVLARERANRTLGLLDWDNLKFDSQEISGLCDATGVTANNALVADLTERTQGWAAGLVLLLERAKTQQPVDWAFTSVQSQETIFNYFAAEIFDLADQRMQRVLLSLAYLLQFTQRMASEISGEPDAGAIVEGLLHRHFFIDKRIGEEDVYQFHALFREFLVKKTKAAYPADEVAQRQRASAVLLEKHGEHDAAVNLFGEVGAFAEMERIISSQSAQLLAQGHTRTLARWIRLLPDAYRAARPMLLYWLGKSELFVDPLHARQVLQQAHAGFVAERQIFGQAMAVADILLSYTVAWKSFEGIDLWIELQEKLLHEHGHELPLPLQAATWNGLLSALMYRQPHRRVLLDCADRVSVLIREELEPNLKLSMAFVLVSLHVWGGRFALCEEVLAYIRPLLQRPEVAPLNRVWIAVVKLLYLSFRADYETARIEFFEMIQLTEKNSLTHFNAVLYLHYAHACHSTGHLQEAAGLIAELDRIIDPRRGMDLMVLYLLKSWHASLLGDTEKAKNDAERMVALFVDTGAIRTYAYALMVRAQANALSGDVDTVRRDLEEVRSLMYGIDSSLVVFHTLLIEAYGYLQSGQRDACRKALAAGLSVGNRGGFTNTIQWIPSLVAALCAEALDAGIETQYAIRLIKTRQLSPPAVCYTENWPWPIAIRTLGNFELRIDGELLQSSRKAQKKPLELLKLLIVRGGKGVSAESIIDALWPDSDGDAAQNAFDSALHRLRKLLKQDDAILLSKGKLSLNPALCWLDIWALERLENEMPSRTADREPQHHATQLFQIYRGPFLEGDVNFPGRSHACAAFRSVFERCLSALCRTFDASGKTAQAVDLLKKGLEIDAEAHDLRLLLKNLRGVV